MGTELVGITKATGHHGTFCWFLFRRRQRSEGTRHSGWYTEIHKGKQVGSSYANGMWNWLRVHRFWFPLKVTLLIFFRITMSSCTFRKVSDFWSSGFVHYHNYSLKTNDTSIFKLAHESLHQLFSNHHSPKLQTSEYIKATSPLNVNRNNRYEI